jgi:integrase
VDSCQQAKLGDHGEHPRMQFMAIWKTKWGWRAEFVLNGKRVMAKGTFKYKDDARQWIKDEKKKLKEEKVIEKKEEDSRSSSQDKDTSYWYFSQKYLKVSKANHVKKTFKEKKSCLERFYEFVGDVNLFEIDPPIVLDYLNKRADVVSNNEANKDRKNLKAFFKWVQEIYGVMHDPTGPVRRMPHTKKQRRLIPIKDIYKVLLMSKGQFRVMLGSYWHTGARKTEVLRWTWADDINFEARWVRLGTRKNRDGEMQYEKLWMNDDLFKLLMWQWKNRHPTSAYVFCHMNPNSKFYGKPFTERRKKLKKLCDDAKVEPFGYHDIRHTVAKYLNDLQKVNLKKVQQVMRHRKQTTTEIYLEGNYTDTKDAMALLELKNLKNLS